MAGTGRGRPAREKTLASPPTMPATWNTREPYIRSQSQSTQETRRRGPGRPSRAASVVLPWVTAWRPSSICTNTFSRQPSTMNQSS